MSHVLYPADFSVPSMYLDGAGKPGKISNTGQDFLTFPSDLLRVPYSVRTRTTRSI
jgi:hypothetical protein